MESVINFWRTIKYLRYSQICHRVKIRLKQKIISRSRYQRKRIIDRSQIRFIRNSCKEAVDRKLFEGPSNFCFLNVRLDTEDSWFPKGASHLWLYNLHYFDYLIDIEDEETFWRLIEGWIRHVDPLTKSAWHSYTTSLRICNWIFSFSARYDGDRLGTLSDPLLGSFLESIYNQTQYVADFLELDVLGNHLIENCKALIVSGAFFGKDAWLDKGLEVLEQQLQEQILADGGHYERSPMYHCIVLEDLLQVRLALVAAGRETEPFDEVIRRMAGFLTNIVELDGSIPLLNDSAYGISLEPDLLLNEVSRILDIDLPGQNRVVFLEDFGLFLVRSPALSLTFDVGANCPDYLPAHAHSDQLSYTLHMDGIPLITDSGTFEYTQGEWRNRFRETASHSTIKIDDIDLIDTWSSFRVGRRGYPVATSIDLEKMVAKCTIDNFHFLDVDVAREIEVLQDFAGIVVTDFYSCKTGGHRFSSYLQLHPELEIGREETTESAKRVEIVFKNSVLAYLFVQPQYDIVIDTSWYSEQFGLKVERIRLCISGELPVGDCITRYALVKAGQGMNLSASVLLKKGYEEN